MNSSLNKLSVVATTVFVSQMHSCNIGSCSNEEEAGIYFMFLLVVILEKFYFYHKYIFAELKK